MWPHDHWAPQTKFYRQRLCVQHIFEINCHGIQSENVVFWPKDSSREFFFFFFLLFLIVKTDGVWRYFLWIIVQRWQLLLFWLQSKGISNISNRLHFRCFQKKKKKARNFRTSVLNEWMKSVLYSFIKHTLY